jgi:hypothetical protein
MTEDRYRNLEDWESWNPDWQRVGESDNYALYVDVDNFLLIDKRRMIIISIEEEALELIGRHFK